MDPIALRACDEPAIFLTDGSCLSHRELLRFVDAFSPILPDDRKCLVALLGDRELGTVAAYLASLRQGHAVAWLAAARDIGQQLTLLSGYEPEVVVGPAASIKAAIETGRYTGLTTAPGDAHVATTATNDPPPAVGANTSLLLLTSGSLSGGRAVRLSAASIATNSDAIKASLEIGDRSRGATSLPLFYTYGLSVLNSHLSAGGSVLLTDTPATGASFWRLFSDARCETFSGVPAQYDWLDRARLPWNETPSLHAMTVSGGRIRTSLARRFHQSCDDAGRKFYKMYGQTETTARISVLRHEDFPAHSESVGNALPGCRVTIDAAPEGGSTVAGAGRIVYHGPSAMQGYAKARADLTKADEMCGTVDTGDLGYLDDGFLYLTGRAGRLVKPDGKRISLDSLEEIFSELAPAAVVGSPDERAHVFVESEHDGAIETARLELLRQTGVGPRIIRLHFVQRLPRRANGKIDYRHLHERVMLSIPEEP